MDWNHRKTSRGKPLRLLGVLLSVVLLFGVISPASMIFATAEEAPVNESTPIAPDAEENGTTTTETADETVPPTEEPEDETAQATPVEYVVSTADGTKVYAYASVGVLPEGAVLKADKLPENSNAFAEAKAAVKATGVAFDGMMAMDIRFEVNGQEVEPDGSVQVRLELAASTIPDEIDPDTVAVQHLAETSSGVQVETVADTSAATNGTVALGEQTVKADFTVDSFSSFTITWGNNRATVTVKYVDQDGNEISGTRTRNVSVDRNSTVTLAEYAGTISGYTYQGAHLSGINGTKVTQIRRNDGNLQYRNENGDWRGLDSNSTVYLVYEEENIKLPDTIEAKVYLRYSNAVPSNINQDFEAADYGPAGDNTPYVTVTVNLKALEAQGVQPYVNSSGYIYFSIDNDGQYRPSGDRKTDATAFWNTYIYPNIAADDQAALNAIFGEGSYIGYVLKQENDGWHIDGVLAEDPPVYVVELYDLDKSNTVVFALSSNDTSLPGVALGDFKTKLETYLGGTDYQYRTTADGKGLIVTYLKDGETYQTTVEPYEGDSYKNYYSVNSTAGKFTYREVTRNVYYLSRLQMKTERMTTALTVKKTVDGNMGDKNKDFSFTLAVTKDGQAYTETITDSNGNSLNVNENGVYTFKLKHDEQISLMLPAGCTLTVAETSVADDGYTTTVKVGENGTEETVSSKTLTLTENTTVLFTNSKTISAPTGVSHNAIPFVLMTVLALGGAASFVVLRKRRDGNAA